MMSASWLPNSKSKCLTCSSMTSHVVVKRQELSLSSVLTLRIQDVSPHASFRTCAGTRHPEPKIAFKLCASDSDTTCNHGLSLRQPVRFLRGEEKKRVVDSCPSYQPRTHDRYDKLSTPLDETSGVREGRRERAAGVRRRAVVLRLRNVRLLSSAARRRWR